MHPLSISRLLGMALAVGVSVLASAMSVGAQAPREEPRIALVIGNSAYPEAPLRNPVNDVRAMAQALRGLGFTVLAYENATKRTMETAIVEFGRRLAEGGVGTFYYAGHGLQVRGRNYLVPVDADYAMNRERQGSPYWYRADVQFDGTHGSGKRTQLRPCNLTFVK